MSKDEKATKELMRTLEDGRHGYEKAAELLSDDHPAVSSRLAATAAKRLEMYTELQNLAATYGDDLEQSGSLGATMHRGWLALKELLSGDTVEAVVQGDNIKAVVNAAMTGEKHSIKLYEKVLAEELSTTFRTVAHRQLGVLNDSLNELQRLIDVVRS